jgi:calcineurin-like phosphoesterase family protein
MGYRVAPFVVILAVVVLALALADGWFSGSSEKTGTSKAFVASDGSSRTVVWALGDGADGGSDARAVARLIARSKPDRFLYLGDVYEEGTPEEFAQNYDSIYGKVASRTAPTPGNHDWSSHTGGYDVYWAKRHGNDLQYYYSFAAGGWQIISLNSEMEHDSGSPQVAWLRSKAKGKGTCRLAFWHRPRYSAGDHHGDQPDVQPFWEALKGHAALVVNGHEHDMQRFKARDGITQFISGAGGHDLYALDKSRPELAFGNSNKFGALRLDLSPGLARYRFVSVQGRTLDSGKVRCKKG